MTTFISIKTLYDQIWNICVRFVLLIFESGKFWRLLGKERCILEGWSCKSMFFLNEISDNFYPDQNTLWSNLKYLCQICHIFEFFKSQKFWWLLGGERCIQECWLRKSMLFKMTFLTTFISIIKLYNQIWWNFFF